MYAAAQPDLLTRLRALDLVVGSHIVACLQTAAELYGFNTDQEPTVHVLDPGFRLRSASGLVVHQREGAPLQLVSSRRATAPAWSAVELARVATTSGLGNPGCRGALTMVLSPTSPRR